VLEELDFVPGRTSQALSPRDPNGRIAEID
jgi:hypothetical protein